MSLRGMDSMDGLAKEIPGWEVTLKVHKQLCVTVIFHSTWCDRHASSKVPSSHAEGGKEQRRALFLFVLFYFIFSKEE